MRTARAAPWYHAALAALVVGAFLLRIGPLQQSMFGDELFLYRVIHHRGLGGVLDYVAGTEKTPPLGFVLAWISAKAGPGDVWARVPSLLAGLATVPLVYVLGARTVGRPAGLVAAAWMAVSPFAVFYATESRGYAIVECLVAGSTLALLTALERGTWRWWVLHGLLAAAALYTHYIAVLVVGPQLLWALCAHRQRARGVLMTSVGIALLFLPWLPSFIDQFRHSGSEAANIESFAPTTAGRLGDISAHALLGHPFLALRNIPGTIPVVAVGAAVVVGLVVSVAGRRPDAGVRRARAAVPATPGALVVLLAVVPVLGLVLYSARPNTSLLLARNLSVAVPYATVLLGWALAARRSRAATAVGCLVALGALTFGAVRFQAGRFQKPDARDAARYVDARVPAAASIINGQVLYSGEPPSQAFVYYLRPGRRVYEAPRFAQGWADAAARGAPVVLDLPDFPGLVALLAMPEQYASRYRLAADHATPGLAYGLLTRIYLPR